MLKFLVQLVPNLEPADRVQNRANFVWGLDEYIESNKKTNSDIIMRLKEQQGIFYVFFYAKMSVG